MGFYRNECYILMIGAVKITPAHDPNDYEIGRRHKLSMITIFSEEGLIIGDYGEFTGMKRFDARKAILKALQDKGLVFFFPFEHLISFICLDE